MIQVNRCCSCAFNNVVQPHPEGKRRVEHATKTSFQRLLPVACVNDEVRYPLEACPIFVVETADRKAVKVQDSKGHVAFWTAQYEGAHDLTLSITIAC